MRKINVLLLKLATCFTPKTSLILHRPMETSLIWTFLFKFLTAFYWEFPLDFWELPLDLINNDYDLLWPIKTNASSEDLNYYEWHLFINFGLFKWRTKAACSYLIVHQKFTILFSLLFVYLFHGFREIHDPENYPTWQ